MAVLLDIHLPMHTCSIWQPMPSVLAGGNLQWVGRLEFEGFPWLHTIREVFGACEIPIQCTFFCFQRIQPHALLFV